MTTSDEMKNSLRAIIEEEIVARFERLVDGDVWHKSDGDLVTRADIAAEHRITALLQAIRPGSVVIGEEAVSRNPSLLTKLNDPSVWIVDPLDSTMNFCNGDPHFSTLIAYCEGGEILRSWTFIPMSELIADAELRKGAYINGRRVRTVVRETKRPVIAFTHPAFRTPDDDILLASLLARHFDLVESRGAGIEYVAMVTGEIDATVLTWDKPWDHAAGALFAHEAGATHVDRGGRPFRLVGDNHLPLVAASTQALSDRLLNSINDVQNNL